MASYDDVLVTLTAEVARSYLQIRTFEERIRLAQENIRIQKRALSISDARFKSGAVSELDVQQAKTLLSTTQAVIPSLQISLRQTQHALSIMLGMPPQDLDGLLKGPEVIPDAPAEVAVGIPADLFRRRPDTRQAVLESEEFKALWERIKHKTIYRMDFDNEKLIEQSAKAISGRPFRSQNKGAVPKSRYRHRQGRGNGQ